MPAAAVLSTGRGTWAHVWAEVEVCLCVCVNMCQISGQHFAVTADPTSKSNRKTPALCDLHFHTHTHTHSGGGVGRAGQQHKRLEATLDTQS